jgi:hypothetical protein
VFAVWLPMLAGDSRSAWDSNVLDDPRVTEFWDGNRIAGKWFAQQQIEGLGGPGSIVWDAYYAFPKTRIGRSSRAASSQPAATSSTTPQASSTTSSRSYNTETVVTLRPPAEPLCDGAIVVRLPENHDVDAPVAYGDGPDVAETISQLEKSSGRHASSATAMLVRSEVAS